MLHRGRHMGWILTLFTSENWFTSLGPWWTVVLVLYLLRCCPNFSLAGTRVGRPFVTVKLACRIEGGTSPTILLLILIASSVSFPQAQNSTQDNKGRAINKASFLSGKVYHWRCRFNIKREHLCGAGFALSRRLQNLTKKIRTDQSKICASLFYCLALVGWCFRDRFYLSLCA